VGYFQFLPIAAHWGALDSTRLLDTKAERVEVGMTIVYVNSFLPFQKAHNSIGNWSCTNLIYNLEQVTRYGSLNNHIWRQYAAKRHHNKYDRVDSLTYNS
jgi:hypothetical protein